MIVNVEYASHRYKTSEKKKFVFAERLSKTITKKNILESIKIRIQKFWTRRALVVDVSEQ